MAVLADRFVRAHRPREADLLAGTWIAIRTVRTQKFMTGGSGADEVRFDSSGLRDADASRAWFYALSFRAESPGRLRVTQQWAGAQPTAHAVAAFAASGTLEFTEDIDADEMITIDCRASDAVHLICLDLEHLGDGFEFARRPPAAISRQPSNERCSCQGSY